MVRDDERRDEPKAPEKEPTHAPGEDAIPGRAGGRKPYPVDDPALADPGSVRGAEPDVVSGQGGALGPRGTM